MGAVRLLCWGCDRRDRGGTGFGIGLGVNVVGGDTSCGKPTETRNGNVVLLHRVGCLSDWSSKWNCWYIQYRMTKLMNIGGRLRGWKSGQN